MRKKSKDVHNMAKYFPAPLPIPFGYPFSDPGCPPEVLRTVRSFDPCLGRDIRMLKAKGGEVVG